MLLCKYIVKCRLFLWCKAEFSALFYQCSVTWSFRNHTVCWFEAWETNSANSPTLSSTSICAFLSVLEATRKTPVHFQATLLSCFSFRTQILHFIQHSAKSVYRTALNSNGLMLLAVNKCAQNTLWLAQLCLLTMLINLY